MKDTEPKPPAPLKWELVDRVEVEGETVHGEPLVRARVVGGWLVKPRSSAGLAFVPDPNAEWK